MKPSATRNICLNCQRWQRDNEDLAIGICTITGMSRIRSWRFQFEGECCRAYRKSGLTRKPHRDTAIAARDKRYAYYIPAGGV